MTEHRPYTVLIVEDEPDILSLIEEHLTEEGYRVVTATTGTAALQRAKSDRPDLILLDVMMPGMNGFDVCNILRDQEETYTTPIIFLTAVAETARKNMGLRMGAVDYITKPFDLRELSARIEAALRHHAEAQSL